VAVAEDSLKADGNSEWAGRGKGYARRQERQSVDRMVLWQSEVFWIGRGMRWRGLII